MFTLVTPHNLLYVIEISYLWHVQTMLLHLFALILEGACWSVLLNVRV